MANNEWRDLSDDKLAEIAQGGMQGQGEPQRTQRTTAHFLT
jgi:hypothetical protein